MELEKEEKLQLVDELMDRLDSGDRRDGYPFLCNMALYIVEAMTGHIGIEVFHAVPEFSVLRDKWVVDGRFKEKPGYAWWEFDDYGVMQRKIFLSELKNYIIGTP